MSVLVITVPPGYIPERTYLLEVVFGEYLGISYRMEIARNGEATTIAVDSQSCVCIRIDDVLFSGSDDISLDGLPFPELHCSTIGSSETGGGVYGLVDEALPVFFLKEGSQPLQCSNRSIKFGFDVLGLIFWMLTRVEEFSSRSKDEHGRCSAEGSHGVLAGYIDRPIVDEYVSILRWAIRRLWPNIKTKENRFSILPTHDVDKPYSTWYESPRGLMREIRADLRGRGTMLRLRESALEVLAVVLNGKQSDKLYTFPWLLSEVERKGLKSSFFFLTSAPGGFDGNYDFQSARLRTLLRLIADRGHVVGLHASYETYKNPVKVKAEKEVFARVCAEENIQLDSINSRQHYLRWETPITAKVLDGLVDYDYSLGYADHAGFRCGTCHEFPLYDLVSRKKLKLRERPLIAMECSVLDNKYQGLKFDEARDYLLLLKERCRKVGGTFQFLWHNTRLVTAEERELFLALIS